MGDDPTDSLTDAELKAFLDAMYPHGVTGADVMNEIAPHGWEQSPLVACFHPPIERVLEEQLRLHRRVAELGARRRRVSCGNTESFNSVRAPITPAAEPTLESLQATWQPQPIKALEELAELVGLCLWDVFSDNHEVLDADGRSVDLGSFRGAGAFLDDYISGQRDAGLHDDYLRFYMGTFAIEGRADLTPVYTSIFQRLHTAGGIWVYYFPELLLVEFGSPNDEGSASRLRADLAATNQRARDEAMDRQPPATVRAYRKVYGHEPRGWPPA